MDKIQFACEHCGQKMRVTARRLGETVTCPKCSQRTMIVADASRAAKSEAAGGRQSADEEQPVGAGAADAAHRAAADPASPTARSSDPPMPPNVSSVDAAFAEDQADEPPASASPDAAPPSAESAPPPSEPPPSEPPPSEPPPSPAPDSAEMFASLALYEQEQEETEWVVERDRDEPNRDFDPHKVAVPRRILYMQGALLAATALGAFMLGALFGRSYAPREAMVAMPQPVTLAGKVEFTRGGLDSQPDEGSVVIAVPRDYKPDLRERRELEKIASASDDLDPSVDVLRNIGGDFAITGPDGRFQLDLPDQGRYYLLVLSGNSQRPMQEELNRLHLSEMGNYFGPALRLIGDRRYHWRTETLAGDQEVNILF